MRKTYRFNHSLAQGGFLYIHKTKNNETIKNKQGLRNALNAIAKKHRLMDVTIRIYDSIFFFFFMVKPSVNHNNVIDFIQKHLDLFGLWDIKYVFTGVYDLQEQYVRKDLNKLGFDYDKG